ncbi:hypothetical protein ACLA_099000 [Aspergillus clavatus NRRL 1]|uniref:Uncharacterized protein n=1 Tax=Aspergillus clavatus (strain ATCC 1007 / CBS 513.65 / DSM 816 / NCTC 3887 / NRRL 1 / QM 1276 / 107) TaxID=344612 RepID=A1CN20_ASPCL|nr:uncharacterized protein ACLA_099000 [Aspergillus clavatus NRRL 1]EAW08957.1 hypothetical protein ACLA_099000 [Aspergillus clavatus NRRL 1]
MVGCYEYTAWNSFYEEYLSLIQQLLYVSDLEQVAIYTSCKAKLRAAYKARRAPNISGLGVKGLNIDVLGIFLRNAMPIISISLDPSLTSTYDHRVWRTGLPVRSAVLKPHAGRLVVGWVTTSESRLFPSITANKESAVKLTAKQNMLALSFGFPLIISIFGVISPPVVIYLHILLEYHYPPESPQASKYPINPEIL